MLPSSVPILDLEGFWTPLRRRVSLARRPWDGMSVSQRDVVCRLSFHLFLLVI